MQHILKEAWSKTCKIACTLYCWTASEESSVHAGGTYPQSNEALHACFDLCYSMIMNAVVLASRTHAGDLILSCQTYLIRLAFGFRPPEPCEYLRGYEVHAIRYIR